VKRPLIALLSCASLSAPAAVSRADYNDTIAGQEGGGSYSIFNENGSSAVGKYQITAATWEQLGYTRYNGTGNRSDYASYSFTDKARSQGVNSISDLRYSTAGAGLQDRANQELAVQNWAAMSARAQSLVGQTVNGIPITQDGLLSASHFLGADALNDWVASGFDPSVLPPSYLSKNGFSSYEGLQRYLLNRIAKSAGDSGLRSGETGKRIGESMYDQTAGFPGIGKIRPVLIQERPPFQGEKETL